MTIAGVTLGPNGECYVFSELDTADLTAQVIQNYLYLTTLITAEYPACPPGTAPVTVTPGEVAETFWRVADLPVPDPSIPPGEAIAGLPAYLLAGDRNSFPFTTPTPLGPLTITATGTYQVDWGDRSADGTTYDTPGAPYPATTGTITHVYLVAGSYTVTVNEHWTATWNLAGDAGTLAGLETTGGIDDFPVIQVQSVITQG